MEKKCDCKCHTIYRNFGDRCGDCIQKDCGTVNNNNSRKKSENMKGLILAGGKGTRLLPVTRVVNKHMIPILNVPMIVYPIETLKSLGIEDIMVVSGGGHIGGIAEFLGDGSAYGVKLTYRVQKEANGIAGALALAEDFVGDKEVVVCLGDNIFDNKEIVKEKRGLSYLPRVAVVFGKIVPDPSRFGVPSFTRGGKVKLITEKPKKPASNYAITGLYKYPNDVFSKIKTLTPSKRGELEISDVNNLFLKEGRLEFMEFSGFWSDAGTPESLKEVINWAYGR